MKIAKDMYETITDMVVLLLRNHSDEFRHRKCTNTAGATVRLLLARDYSWPAA